LHKAALYCEHSSIKKGSHERDKWLPDERRKVACGERHFRDALGVDYKVIVAAEELP